MKVAMVSTVADRCGIADYTSGLCAGLVDAGVEVERFSLDRAERERPGFHATLARRLAEADADVVHVQHEFSFFGGVMPPDVDPRALRALGAPAALAPSGVFDALRGLQSPLVMTVHELISPEAPRSAELGLRLAAAQHFMRYATQLTFALADVVIAHSLERAQRVMEMGVDPGRVHVVPLSIRVPPSHEARARARAQLGIAPAERLVSTFGFVSPRKGLSDLLHALQRLPPDVTLAVVGGDPPGAEGNVARFAEEVYALGLGPRVRVLGYLSEAEVARWLAATDVYALVPHAMGGGSMSLNAAVAAGLPVVATALPQMEEIEARYGCLHLVPVGDAEAIAAGVARLLEEGPARAARAEALAARSRWSLPREVQSTVGLYVEAARTRQRPPRGARWSWRRALRAAVDEDGDGPVRARQLVRLAGRAIAGRALG